MYGHDEGADKKMGSLRDLILEMKKLHAEGLNDKPKGVALEVHESHVEPLDHDALEKLEEQTHEDLDNDNEEGESPEHQAAVLGEDEECEDEGEEPEMHIPEGLLKLIAEKLAK